MKHWIKSLDQILRGETTRLTALRRGTFDVPVRGLSFIILVMAMIAGACMGVTAVVARFGTPTAYMGVQQLLASTVKVPLLFFLTLLITFPSLYVFNALVGSRLNMLSLLRLLVAALAVMTALLASFGPIIAFFAVSTTSYPFMKLLDVVVFALAGGLGLVFLLQTLHRLTSAQNMLADEPTSAVGDPAAPPLSAAPISAPPVPAPPGSAPGALERSYGRTPAPNVKVVFRIWVVVFGLVGAQMSWVLRPFVGDPALDFSFFRPRQSNFFEQIWHTLSHLVGG